MYTCCSVTAGRRTSGTFSTGAQKSQDEDDYNHWSMKAVETRPDESQHIVYTNFIGQILIKELTDGTGRWIEHRQYNADGRLILRAQPSAVIGYDDSQADLDVETKVDDRGRTFQTIEYGVDPSTGTVGNALVGNTWYDAADHGHDSS